MSIVKGIVHQLLILPTSLEVPCVIHDSRTHSWFLISPHLSSCLFGPTSDPTLFIHSSSHLSSSTFIQFDIWIGIRSDSRSDIQIRHFSTSCCNLLRISVSVWIQVLANLVPLTYTPGASGLPLTLLSGVLACSSETNSELWDTKCIASFQLCFVTNLNLKISQMFAHYLVIGRIVVWLLLWKSNITFIDFHIKH